MQDVRQFVTAQRTNQDVDMVRGHSEEVWTVPLSIKLMESSFDLLPIFSYPK